ncbi:MAG: hypothetical protein JSU08_03235 [Acidobacteria bacterium]|nr:hypothetical protein [Acidobacteriota bacterium]
MASTPGADAARTLTATASYLLSEDGRKASLLSGGDGRSVQQITLQVPANRLHLVSVDRQGVARLKLRPRFEMNATGIIRVDTAPMYDLPPTVDELYRAAAKNHELETAYHAQRTALRAKRTDDGRARRQSVAEAFLADKGQRAASHPPPTPKTCYVITDRGGVLFDVSIDQGLAKDVPPEAHRRFRADRRAYQEQVRQDQIAQAALHEEKKQFIAEWINTNGTEEEKARQASGVLPMAEAVARISDQLFAAIDTRPVYVHDGAQRLQKFIGECTGSADVVVTPADVVARSAHATMASAEEWAAIREIQEQLPEAHAVLRHHLLLSRRHQGVPSIVIIGALVTLKHGPFVLRREYVVSDRQSAAAPVTEVDRN